MPSPERTSLAAIVTAGRELLESDGSSRLTMQAVAGRVGVRAPSLYKRVRDRDALLGLVATATLDDLVERLAVTDGSIAAIARTYRALAHDWPEGFRLILTAPADAESLARVTAPVIRATAEFVGSEQALEAARLVTAWATGFIVMELSGAFRLTGDLEAAFDFGLARLTAALSLDLR